VPIHELNPIKFLGTIVDKDGEEKGLIKCGASVLNA
jgi:hypothetical protein